jgi:NRAMP (natural resistance-associated macrophage protein)-like metal ion transporter
MIIGKKEHKNGRRCLHLRTTQQQRLMFKKLRKAIGPGVITGASDDDPSGIATYTQAGAAFGLQFLWTAVATYPLMVSVQEMCARIGIVTRQGLTGILKKHYPRPVLWIMILFSFPAIILNISADFAGMGAVGHMLFPVIPSFAFAFFFCLLLLFNLIRLSYRRIANILRFLCLVLLCYVIVPFLSKQHWGEVLRNSFFPQLVFDKNFFALLVGILGTTISPYLFFWQTSMEVEEVTEKEILVDKAVIHEMENDVQFGIFFPIPYFILLSFRLQLNYMLTVSPKFHC